MISFIYVAGPYSAETAEGVEANVARALDAGDRLLDLGFNVFVPHLSHYQHARRPREYETWLLHDLAWLTMCDALLRIPGASPGADREAVAMEGLGKPVFRDIDALVAAADRARASREAYEATDRAARDVPGRERP